jgi:hypothetical protein
MLFGLVSTEFIHPGRPIWAKAVLKDLLIGAITGTAMALSFMFWVSKGTA